MLKEIISITGKPGLYKILSQGRGTLIVENIEDKHRFPVHARDKVVSLGDISMYTQSGDTPLGEILDKLYQKYDGKEIDLKNMEGKALHAAFGEVVEDYDRDRVRDNDIKKLFKWYNILIGGGMTLFTKKEETDSEENTGKKEAEETKLEK